MLLSEPPRGPGDINFALLGIPVRVHPFFWLMSVLMCLRATEGDPRLVISWVVASFVSILVHEMGHALAIRHFGWQPWVTLYGMGGLASYQPTRHDARTQILISFAGPGAGFVFAAVITAVLYATGHPVKYAFDGPMFIDWQIAGIESHSLRLWDFVEYLLYINIWWGLVNLLPVYPLDGGNIARELLSSRSADGLRASLQLSIVTAIMVAGYGWVKLQSGFMAIFFGYLAFMSYQMLQSYSGRGGNRW